MTRAKSMFIVALVALAAVLAGTMAGAQPPGGRRGGPPGGGPPGGFGGPGGGGGLLGLLRSEAVQKELNLVDDQKTALTEMGQKVFGNMRDQFAGLRDLDQAARDAKLAELRKQTQQRTVEAEKEVEKILLPQQFQRAKGILVQAEGTRALSDPAIADDLGLSAQQRSQLEAIQNAVREVMRQAFTGGPDASQEQRRAGFEKMQAAQKEADQRARAVLTPQQQQKLEQMKGEPFDVQQLRRGGPGGPGGPPPGGPGGPPPGA